MTARPFRAVQFPLESRRLTYRPPGPADVEQIVSAISDRRIARATLNIPFPYRRSDALEFVTRSRQARAAGESLGLLIMESPDGPVVGGIALFAFDWKRSTAAIGYWITPSAWGRGFATEAVRRLARVAFQDLKLHRLEAGTFEFNEASGRVLLKAGFTREGLARGDVRKGGRWWNSVTYGLLRTDARGPGLSSKSRRRE